MKPKPPFWQNLFNANNAPDAAAVMMRLLKKRGAPLLLLPNRPDLAVRGLDLYPAQTFRGRLARSLARWILSARLPFGVNPVQVKVTLDDSFVRWLNSLANVSESQVPQFAVLAGNPSSPGQRLIMLLFDSAAQPVTVIKVGLTKAAQELVRQEQEFLKNVPQTFPAIPTLRGAFVNDRLQALALDYLPGRSPVAKDEVSLPSLLMRWIHPQKEVPFVHTRVARELASVCPNNPLLKTQLQRLQSRSYRAAVYHGDFTPWNVRVSPDGKWTVLDWERGEVNGLPGWDWFHYLVQKAILVQKQNAEAVAASVEALLTGADFAAYAEACRLNGTERVLLLLYLIHHTEVIQPAEGLAVTQDLIQLLSARWR